MSGRDKTAPDRFEPRYQDYTLTDEQAALRELVADCLSRHCPTSVVRAARPLGFDGDVWERLTKLGVVEMGVPAEMGGDGAGLAELAVVAEEVGRRLAPVPYTAHVAATRLLAGTVGPGRLLADALAATEPITVAPHRIGPDGRLLVPEAAAARHVIALVGDELSFFTGERPADHLPSQGDSPLAWWSPGDAAGRQVLAEGPAALAAHERAVAEWKLLTAGALVGLCDAALGLAVEFARSRHTLGVPIGSLQGVAFPLADAAIEVAGVRNLVRRAAWFTDHEPDEHPGLTAIALAATARVATSGTRTAVHVHGGLGVSTEADVSLYFLRAAAWGVLGGDRLHDDVALGRRLLHG